MASRNKQQCARSQASATSNNSRTHSNQSMRSASNRPVSKRAVTWSQVLIGNSEFPIDIKATTLEYMTLQTLERRVYICARALSFTPLYLNLPLAGADLELRKHFDL